MANPVIYSTTNMEGVDVNSVFYLDTKSYPEYPAQPFLAGTQAYGTDGSAWVYATSSVSLANGAVVIVSEIPGSWSVALVGGSTIASAPTGDLIGVVAGGNGSLVVGAPSGTQTASYFWLQRAGNCQALLVSSAGQTKDAQLYCTKTLAGYVSSTAGGAASTYQVNGIVISQNTASTIAGQNTAILNYPVVGTSA